MYKYWKKVSRRQLTNNPIVLLLGIIEIVLLCILYFSHHPSLNAAVIFFYSGIRLMSADYYYQIVKGETPALLKNITLSAYIYNLFMESILYVLILCVLQYVKLALLLFSALSLFMIVLILFLISSLVIITSFIRYSILDYHNHTFGFIMKRTLEITGCSFMDTLKVYRSLLKHFPLLVVSFGFSLIYLIPYTNLTLCNIYHDVNMISNEEFEETNPLYIGLCFLLSVFLLVFNVYMSINDPLTNLSMKQPETYDRTNREINKIERKIEQEYNIEIHVVSSVFSNRYVDLEPMFYDDTKLLNFYRTCLNIFDSLPEEVMKNRENKIDIYYGSKLHIHSMDDEGGKAVGFTVQNKINHSKQIYISSEYENNSSYQNLLEVTLYHEFFHIIAEDMKFNANVFREMNPDKFKYGKNNLEDYYKYKDYFLSPYSMSSPKEDACEIFANYMTFGYETLETKEVQMKWEVIKNALLEHYHDEKFIKVITQLKIK